RRGPVDPVSAILAVSPLSCKHVPFVVVFAHARLTLRVVHDGDVSRAIVRQDVALLCNDTRRPVAAPQRNRQALGDFTRAPLDRHGALAVEVQRKFSQVHAVPAILRHRDALNGLVQFLVRAALEVQHMLGDGGLQKHGHVLQSHRLARLARLALFAVLAILSGGGGFSVRYATTSKLTSVRSSSVPRSSRTTSDTSTGSASRPGSPGGPCSPRSG